MESSKRRKRSCGVGELSQAILTKSASNPPTIPNHSQSPQPVMMHAVTFQVLHCNKIVARCAFREAESKPAIGGAVKLGGCVLWSSPVFCLIFRGPIIILCSSEEGYKAVVTDCTSYRLGEQIGMRVRILNSKIPANLCATSFDNGICCRFVQQCSTTPNCDGAGQ